MALTESQLHALTTRADLLASECTLVADQGITWACRARALQNYGRAGGSAMDRRLVVEAMAALEEEAAPKVGRRLIDPEDGAVAEVIAHAPADSIAPERVQLRWDNGFTECRTVAECEGLL